MHPHIVHLNWHARGTGAVHCSFALSISTAHIRLSAIHHLIF